MACRFCANNRTNPEWELTEEQCCYAMTVGESENGYRIMIDKDPYKPIMLEFSRWNSSLNPPIWQVIGGYFPKFCPECGRKIDEYDRSKFDSND